jgi:hypothetical protein
MGHQGFRILEKELVKVFRAYRDVRQIWLDVFCLPTFACEKEVREPRDRVGWKFRTREVGYKLDVFYEENR